MRHSGRGVTMMDALLVCTILGILAAVIAPVVLQAQEDHRVLACVSNSQQLAAALLSYSSDWDGIVPGGELRLDKGGRHIITWDQAIDPYLENVAVFHCPNDCTGGTRSYSVNDQRCRSGDDGFGDVSGIRLSVIADPCKTALLREWHHPDNNLESGQWVAAIAPPSGHSYHRGDEGSVIAYFDGHAECMVSGQLTVDNFYYDPDP